LNIVHCSIVEDATKTGSVTVHGLWEVPVHNKHEGYGILLRGSIKRQTAGILMNAESRQV